MPFHTDWCISVVKFKTVAEKSRCKHFCRERVPPSWANTNGHNSNGLRTVIKVYWHWSASMSFTASAFLSPVAIHQKCLHWAAPASVSFIHVSYFNEVHGLYMASASIRFFMKDADAVKDADADQCKRTSTLSRSVKKRSCAWDYWIVKT